MITTTEKNTTKIAAASATIRRWCKASVQLQ